MEDTPDSNSQRGGWQPPLIAAHALVGWSGQRMASATDRSLCFRPHASSAVQLHGLPASGGCHDVSWVKQDSSRSSAPLSFKLDPSFAKLAMPAKKRVANTRAPSFGPEDPNPHACVPYASLAAQLAPAVPRHIDWHPIHALRGCSSMPTLCDESSAAALRDTALPPRAAQIDSNDGSKTTVSQAGADAEQSASLPHQSAAPAATLKSRVTSQLSLAIKAIDTLEELVRHRQAKCLEVLRRPTEERSNEDLSLLGEWASKIIFRDKEVQRLIDPLMLCKAMRYQTTKADEIIISQGEEGDAFYAIFSGAASVYVAFDVEDEANTLDPLSTQNASSAVSWSPSLVRTVDARLRRLRRQEKGEVVTPEPAPRMRRNCLAGAPPGEGTAPEPALRRRSVAFDGNNETMAHAGESEPTGGGAPQLTQRRFSTGSSSRRGVPIRQLLKRRASQGNGLIRSSSEAPMGRCKSRGHSNLDSITESMVVAHSAQTLQGTNDTGATTSYKGLKKVFTYRDYDSFGDLALLLGAPRSASVVAEPDTILVRVERAEYNAVVRAAALDAVRQRASFLATLPALGGLHFQQLVKISGYIKREELAAGSAVFAEGHANEDVVIIQEGEAEVRRRISHGTGSRLLTLGVGMCVGALAMDASAHRALLPSLVASHHTGCVVLRLNRREFEFRTGRRVVAQMGAHEATAWLNRLDAPGPLRRLMSATTSTSSLEPCSPSRSGARLPPLKPLKSQGSTSLSSMRTLTKPDDHHSKIPRIEEWLLARRQILHATIQEDIKREATLLAKAREENERQKKAEQRAMDVDEAKRREWLLKAFEGDLPGCPTPPS
jgi:CRP-like cAMP-binding protein